MERTPDDPRIRVLIVDDHPLLREGLTSVIDSEPDLRVVGQAVDGLDAIEQYGALRPDVTLMDTQMPRLDGIAAARAICERWPGARIVMLTTYDGDAHALGALKAGASGYLLKGMVRTKVFDAIRTVHAGRRFIPEVVAAALAAHVTDELLSPREVEVLREVARGGSNRTIATRLFVSEETVKSHLKSILGKLAASDRTQAVVIAIRRGIIDI